MEKNREVGDRYIQHTLMISNFRVCLTLALRNMPDVNLLFWTRENPQELKDYVYFREGVSQRKLSIVPDGFFGIEDPKGKMYFFLEADRSTMTNTRFLNKMRAYWLWWKQGGQRKRFGIENFRVLTITRSKQRMGNLIKVTRQADDKQSGSYMFWFACEEDFSLTNPQSVLQNVWKVAVVSDEKLHSLLE